MVNQKIISLGIPGVSQPQRTLVLTAQPEDVRVPRPNVYSAPWSAAVIPLDVKSYTAEPVT